MTKVRKVKRRKRFRVNINRKRLRNKLRKLPDIECPPIKGAWEITKSVRSNLTEMGIAYDANEALKIPNVKQALIKDAKQKVLNEEEVSDSEDENVEMPPPKVHVVEELEAEAKAPRERLFRLPNGQVQFFTYLLDKYGEDYKAMARDKKNYYQLTWKQIRAKVKTFKGIPAQYNAYLSAKQE